MHNLGKNKEKKMPKTTAYEFFKLLLLFLMGGMIYFAIELAYKGESHFSMFIVGGVCFVLIGALNSYFDKEMTLLKQMLLSALIITVLEFFSGCIVNLWLGLRVWDYGALPFNLWGQICLPFTMVWFLLSLPAIFLDDFFRCNMFSEKKKRSYLPVATRKPTAIKEAPFGRVRE